mgnify:CR=1 FL=1
MNTLEAIKKRRSNRTYVKEAEITAEDMRQIRAAANVAPYTQHTRPSTHAIARN